MIAAALGSERQGDHVVKTLGWDVDSSASTILFRTVFKAVYALLEVCSAFRKWNVIKQTFSSAEVVVPFCIAAFRKSHVRHMVVDSESGSERGGWQRATAHISRR